MERKRQRESFAEGILSPSTRPGPAIDLGNAPETWDEEETERQQGAPARQEAPTNGHKPSLPATHPTNDISELLTNSLHNKPTNKPDDNIVNNSTNRPSYTEADVMRWRAEARQLTDLDEYPDRLVGTRVAEPYAKWLERLINNQNENSRRGRKISRQDVIEYGLRLVYVEIMKNGGVFKKNMGENQD